VNQRVFQQQRLWQLDADTVHHATAHLADRERPHDPQLVVGIQRGGWHVATAVAALLDVPAVPILARHNDTDTVGLPATGRVRIDATTDPPALAPGRVLIVDDICGSGATLRTVSALLSGLWKPALLRTAVLCRNAGAAYEPDSWIWDVADWVCFPWEPDPGRPTEPLALPVGVNRR